MMGSPWPWALRAYCQPPPGSVSPRLPDSDSLRLKEQKKSAGVIGLTLACCFHEQVTAPVWALVSEEERILNVRITYRSYTSIVYQSELRSQSRARLGNQKQLCYSQGARAVEVLSKAPVKQN